MQDESTSADFLDLENGYQNMKFVMIRINEKYVTLQLMVILRNGTFRIVQCPETNMASVHRLPRLLLVKGQPETIFDSDAKNREDQNPKKVSPPKGHNGERRK
jgi:hypothetical protein